MMNVVLKKGELTLLAKEDITVHNVEQLIVFVKAKLEKKSSAVTILLDLSDIRLIDSSGLKLILGIYRFCEKEEKTFRVRAASQGIIRVLHFCGLNRLIQIEQVTS